MSARALTRAAAWTTAVVLACASALVAAPAYAAPTPDTVIDTGPAASVNVTNASFTFHSTRTPATFTCKLDTAAATSCSSGVSYTNLAQGLHTFTVAATAGGQTDSSPATLTWRVDQTPPSLPTSLTGNGATPTSVVLSWTASTDNVGVTGYDVFRNGVKLASVGAVTTFTDSTVTAGSSHPYAVRSRDAAGNSSALTTAITVTTPTTVVAPDTVIDSAPAALTKATAASIAFHSTITGSTFTCRLDGGRANACTSPVAFNGLAEGAHTVTVAATANGVTDATPAAATWTIDLTAPSVPASITSTTDGSSAALSWTAATDANGVAGYDVYRGTALLASVGAVTSYSDTTVTRGSVYLYSVRAKDAVGNVSAASSLTSIKVMAPYDAHLTRAPYLTDLVGNHVAINYATDQSATTGTVLWGAVDGTGACTPSTTVVPARVTIQVGPVTEYQWTAQVDLPTAGTYCYRVRLGATDLLGANPSPRFTTQTAFGSTASYSFAVIGDWGQVDGAGRNQDQENLLAQMANSGARFAVSVGDNGYPNGNQVDYGDLQQTATSAIFGPKGWSVPGSTLPIFTAVGNHGVSGVTHTDITTWTQARAVATSGGRYQNDVYCCVNGSSSVNYGSEWYAFDVGNARFYVLDSAWGDTNAGTADPYANDALAHFAPGTPEYTWLANDLATHTPQLKFAFSHYPFYSDQKDEPSDTFLQGAANLEGLLGRNGVQLVFNGHAHIYQRNTASAAGMPITYITGAGLGAVAGSNNNVQPVGPCLLTNDAYAIGWSPSSGTGSACGRGVAPTSSAQLTHFLKVTVSGTSVTVTPTDSTGRTFDVQTYNFRVAPDTYLDSTPAVGTTSSSATFTFHSTGANASYTCSLDGAAATSCTSPKTYTGLAQAKHTFKVTAKVGTQSDTTPALWSWTVDSTVPSRPASLAATATSPFSVNLSWPASTDNTGVTGYDIYRDGSPLTQVGPVTAYVDNAVLGSSPHSYQVRARDVAGNTSAFAGPASATTPPPPVPVIADGFEGGTLAGWTSKGLVLQSSTVHGGAQAVEGNTTTGSAYAKRTLPATYSDAYARVWFDVVAQPDQVNLLRLRDAAGNSLGYAYVETTGQLGFHNDALGTNALSATVPAPGWHALELHLRADSAAGVADGAVELWLDNVRIADLSSTAVDTGSAPVGILQIGETQTGQTYDVAFDDVAFGTSRLGPVADTVAPTAPATVTATATSAFSADVTWSPATDASGVSAYRVLRDGVLVATVDGATTTWTDSALLPSTTYGWTVVAVDLAGNASAPSTSGVATTPAAAIPVFADGFETGTTSSWTSSTGLTVQGTTVRNGAFAAEGATPTGVAFAKKTLSAGPYADAYARVAFDALATNGNQVTLLRLRDTATGSVGFVFLSATGRLGFTGGSGLTATTLTSAVVPGPGWHAVELHIASAGASSVVEVWLDGALVDALSGTVDLTGSGPITVMQIGDTAANAGGWDVVLDDAAFGTSRLGPSGDVVPPTAPTVTASASSAFSVDLTWTAATDNTGVTGYDIARDGTPIASVDGATTAWTDTSVSASTTYTYSVVARDGAGNVSPASTATATTGTAAPPLFSDGFETGSTTAWTSSQGLTVQSTTVNHGGFAAEAASATGSTNAKKTLPGSYTDSYARVAFDALATNGNQVTLLRLRDTASGSVAAVFLSSQGRIGVVGGPSGPLSVTRTSLTVPSAGWHSVELHVVSAGASSTVEVWLDGVRLDDISGAMDLSSSGAVTILQVGDTATSSTGGWDVVLDDAAFGTSRLGTSGDVTSPSAPTVTATATSAFSVDLAWTASTDDVGVVGYDIARDGAPLASVDGATLAFTDSTALALTSYSYVVTARDAAGNVGASPAAQVTTAAAAAPVFSDGFETGSTSAWTSSQGLTVQSATVAHGGYAAEGASTTGTTYAKKTLPGSYTDSYARVAFDALATNGNQVTLLRLRDTASGSVMAVFLSNLGKVGITGGPVGASTSRTGAAVAGTGWHSVEVHVVSAGAGSTVEVWLDGARLDDISGGIDLSASGAVTILQVGDTAASSSGGWDLVLDDAAFGTSRLGIGGDVTAPSAPTLSATATSPFSIDLGWTASTDDVGVVAYDITRNGLPLTTVGPGTLAFTDSTVLASTAYSYVVTARDAAGNVAMSAAAPLTTAAAAAPVFADGFETGNLNLWTSASNLAVQTASVHSGTYAARGGLSTGNENAKKTLPGSYSDAYARVAFDVLAQNSLQTTLLRLRDTASGSVAFVFLSGTGKLGVSGDAAGSRTTPGSISAGWHSVELHVVVAGGSSLLEVWLDGAKVDALSGPANLGLAGPVTILQIGDTVSSATGWDVALDDAAFSTGRIGLSGDSTAPSTPTLTAAVSDAFTVGLSWTAATDDTGVVGYDVARNGVPVGTVDGATLVWTDTNALASTTYTYAVTARDVAGNVSSAGTAVAQTPAAATPVFANGFETADTAWTTTTNLTTQSTTVRTGISAGEAIGAGTQTFVKRTIGGTYGDAYARVAFTVKSQTSAISLLRLRYTSATGNGVFVGLAANGKLQLRSDAVGNTLTSSLSVTPGWHVVELHARVGATGGSDGVVEVWLDGAKVPDLSFTAYNVGPLPFGWLQLGDASNVTYDVVFDDAAFGTSRLGVS
ncbi:MAG TPA: metallophosphoesterase [Candidatus Nanopelagicales bacterium]|nr:metallophosphoesterase [Candidatus Nanopelagicales bacterium]